MTQRTQRRKMGILLALLLPITMLLSACKSDNTIEITSGGGMNFTMDMVDTDGLMASSGITCDMMSDLMSAEEPIPDGIFEVEDISQGDNLGCRFTISTPFAVDGNILVDDGDSYTLNLSSEDMGGADMSELDGLGPLEFTFNVTMPGPITDASEGGQINGNTVTFTDPKFLESGFSVTGQKSGNSSSGTSGNSDNEGSGSSSNASDSQSDGTSVWVWILIGVGVLAIIGGITAIFAATVGMMQNDIKRVIAYSTCSQLGYMFFAAGVGAYGAAMFHLFTHAFFKALLFLGAGSVIHGLHHEQDMRRYGNLRKYIPVTFVTVGIGWLAISGIPPFAGFWSKDKIIESAFAVGGTRGWILGLATLGFQVISTRWPTPPARSQPGCPRSSRASTPRGSPRPGRGTAEGRRGTRRGSPC